MTHCPEEQITNGQTQGSNKKKGHDGDCEYE